MQTPWATVVGEVADVKESSPDIPAKQQYYVTVEQAEALAGSLGTPTDAERQRRIHRHTHGHASGADGKCAAGDGARYRSAAAADPDVQTMEHAISDSEAPRRFNTALISSFAAAAVLLAVLGIYSVIAFSVALRVQEMAIRMALGSQRSGIVRSGCGFRSQAGADRLRDRAGGRGGRFAPVGLVSLRSERVRSAGADAGRGVCDAAGIDGLAASGATGGGDRSDAGAAGQLRAG